MNDLSSEVPIRPAATILLLRDAPQLQVLMVQRHHEIDFAPGALVFPGGKSHPGDHDEAWADHVLGWPDFAPEQRALRIAAIREVFEEAGVLLACRRDGAPIGAAACPMETRKAVDAGTVAFLDVVRDLEALLDLHALAVFARWITPNVPKLKRFDTWFFAARTTVEQLAASDGRETVDAVWLSPDDALRMGEEGERKVVFPTRMNLRLLAQSASADDAIASAKARRLVTVEPRRVEGPNGPMLVLPPDAGYGDVAESLARVF